MCNLQNIFSSFSKPPGYYPPKDIPVIRAIRGDKNSCVSYTNTFYILSYPLYFHLILSRDSRDWRETKKEKDSQANLTDTRRKILSAIG